MRWGWWGEVRMSNGMKWGWFQVSVNASDRVFTFKRLKLLQETNNKHINRVFKISLCVSTYFQIILSRAISSRPTMFKCKHISRPIRTFFSCIYRPIQLLFVRKDRWENKYKTKNQRWRIWIYTILWLYIYIGPTLKNILQIPSYVAGYRPVGSEFWVTIGPIVRKRNFQS